MAGARIIPTVMFLLGLAACSGSDNDADALRDAILESTNMPEELATCFANKAEEQLSEDGRAFLIASMRDDEQRINELRGRMTLAELTGAGMFMASAGANCGMDEHFGEQ